MTQEDTSIEHVADGKKPHGPVTLFISDAGEMILVCERDKQVWRLKHNAEPVEGAREDLDLADDVAPRSRSLQRIDSRALAMRAFKTH